MKKYFLWVIDNVDNNIIARILWILFCFWPLILLLLILIIFYNKG